jgi:hypothetical protein
MVLKKLLKGVCAAGVAVTAVQAEKVIELDDGMKLTLGGDVRMYLTHFDRNVLFPDSSSLPEEGPAIEYARFRERFRAELAVNESIRLNTRFTHRWQKFSSNIGNPNDRGPATWQFEDELVVDTLNVQVDHVGGSPWCLTLGRQDVMFGNGMVFLEGTPYDQGRTIYFDGVHAMMKGEKDTISLFAFYNNYRDRYLAIGDEDRRLRRGDVFTTGLYWTRSWSPVINTDLYTIYADFDDQYPESAEGVEYNHPLDENARICTSGIRLFGELHPQVSYSAEFAGQYGHVEDSRDAAGSMADLRLMLKADEDTPLRPELNFKVTYLSGDDRSTDKYEGWHPMFSEYPIWREELLAIMTNAHWTNFTQYRSELVVNLNDQWRLTGNYSYLQAVENNGTGDGDEIGHLISGFVDYRMSDQWSFSMEAAGFFPGDYFADGESSEWVRFMTMYTF